MPMPTTSSRARAPASWRPGTPSGGDWSATCTTAPSSGSSRSRSSCAWSRAASRATPTRARQDLAEAREQLEYALDELRELARGIHPAVLTDGGLARALSALAHRAPLPVEIDDVPDERLPEPVEAAAYYLIAEAITNVAKHARATHVAVSVRRDDGASAFGSPTTVWVEPTPAPARACTASPTASRRSMGT